MWLYTNTRFVRDGRVAQLGFKLPVSWPSVFWPPVFSPRLETHKESQMETSHVSALQSKHAGIEAQLREEEKRPAPDTATIQALKKKKLRIKEELAAV